MKNPTGMSEEAKKGVKLVYGLAVDLRARLRQWALWGVESAE
jgi:hypothetical protein